MGSLVHKGLMRWVLVALVLVLAGCGTCERPQHLYDAHARIVKYYESGCFYQEVCEVMCKARAFFSQKAQHARQAVIFDIDETTLSEYCNFKSIKFGYVPKLSHEWVVQAAAPALVPVLNFYKFLLKQGYRAIFLTGRINDEYEASYKNLVEQGYGGFDKLIVRGPEDAALSAEAYKSRERAKLVAEGYEIVGCVGDQLSDMRGGNTGEQILIPNYLYRIE